MHRSIDAFYMNLNVTMLQGLGSDRRGTAAAGPTRSLLTTENSILIRHRHEADAELALHSPRNLSYDRHLLLAVAVAVGVVARRNRNL